MDQTIQWQPSCDLATLRQRAQLLSDIRQFFAQRNVLEVDTQCLSLGSVTDVHLRAFSTEFISPISANRPTLYLQTSPEFAMKRLLCAGSGSIYQLGKVFRNEEAGRNHNPEFTLLEWYRVDFDDLQLIDEVDALLRCTLGTEPLECRTYQSLFVQYCQFDPLTLDKSAFEAQLVALGHEDIVAQSFPFDTLLQWAFCEIIEPQIGLERPIAVTEFPASQAALARLDSGKPGVARRFEIYFRGLELANGYHELQSADEHLARFHHDNEIRRQNGLPEIPIDHHFIAALKAGLPNCAGVALGFDRLLMIATDKSHIRHVIPFEIDRA